MEAVIILFFLLTLYCVPMIIAIAKGHKNKVAISVLNILVGWTFIGWIAALIWSLTK